MPRTLTPPDIEAIVDDFVERWYCREMDIGRTRILGVEVDLMPDSVEKHLYKKVIMAVLAFLREGQPTLSLAGLDFEVQVRPAADRRTRGTRDREGSY